MGELIAGQKIPQLSVTADKYLTNSLRGRVG